LGKGIGNCLTFFGKKVGQRASVMASQRAALGNVWRIFDKRAQKKAVMKMVYYHPPYWNKKSFMFLWSFEKYGADQLSTPIKTPKRKMKSSC